MSLLLAAALWRVAMAKHPEIASVAPFAAIGFCAALYSGDWRIWVVPAAALAASDVWLNYSFGFSMSASEVFVRLTCFLLTLVLGSIAGRRGLSSLAAGFFGCELLFYLLTNTAAWQTDPFYTKNFAGWSLALTVGHPEYPPTWWFFRNSFIGDIGFAVIFLLVLKTESVSRVATTRSPLRPEIGA